MPHLSSPLRRWRPGPRYAASPGNRCVCSLHPHTRASTLQVFILYTSVTSDKLIRANQERLLNLFFVRKIPVKEIDASDASNKTLREALFAISRQRAVYPQVFVEHENGTYGFVGNFKDIHTMNEHNDITGAFEYTFSSICPAYAATLTDERKMWLSKRSAELDALRKKWEEHVSKAGEPYWFCRATGESSWVDPRAAVGPGAEWIPQTQQETGKRFFYNFKTGKSAWRLPEA